MNILKCLRFVDWIDVQYLVYALSKESYTLLERLPPQLVANYKDILTANLTLVGTVLAIFFTLITLPIQNILGKYSQDLVNRVSNDRTFTYSFYFLAATFLYNLLLFAVPPYTGLILLSLLSGILSILAIVVLVRRTFFLLDVRNQLRNIAKDVVRQMAPALNRYKSLEQRRIGNSGFPGLQKIAASLIRYGIPRPFVDWLQKETEIVIDIIQKGIQENRFEVVESGLQDVCTITGEYVSATHDFETHHDPYVIFVLERLIETKNLILPGSHHKIMIAFVNACGTLGRETLRIRPRQPDHGGNSTPLGFVNLLEQIILSEEILKETSYATAVACRQLVEIGEKAVEMGYSRTTTELIVPKLGNISRRTVGLHLDYTDYVSNKANMGLCDLFRVLLVNLGTIKVHRTFALGSVAGEINKSIRTYLEDDYDRPLRSNIVPFAGVNCGLAEAFISAIQRHEHDEREMFDILGVLGHFLAELSQNIDIGTNRGKHWDVDSILRHIYTLGIFLSMNTVSTGNPNISQSVTNILDKHIVEILRKAISMLAGVGVKKTLPADWETNLDILSSLMGIMFVENKKDIFTPTIEKTISEIIKTVDLKKSEIYIEVEGELVKNYVLINGLSALYQHLRQMGSWLFRWMPTAPLLEDVKKAIKEQPQITFRESMGGIVSSIDQYPTSELGMDWIVERPILAFDQRYFQNCDNALSDSTNREKFDHFLENVHG